MQLYNKSLRNAFLRQTIFKVYLTQNISFILKENEIVTWGETYTSFMVMRPQFWAKQCKRTLKFPFGILSICQEKEKIAKFSRQSSGSHWRFHLEMFLN